MNKQDRIDKVGCDGLCETCELGSYCSYSPYKDDDNPKDEEIKRLTKWVNDLQSGMYINCVYCGHRYGPNDEVPESMADVLKKHIEECPEHPMSKLTALNRELEAKSMVLEKKS